PVASPAPAPAFVSGGTLVFLCCSTAFGVVLTLGGLRYGTIESEIYLLTTAFLDLRGAAVLSVLQLLAVVAMLAVASRTRARREQALRRVGDAARRPRRGGLPGLGGSGLALALGLAPAAPPPTRARREQALRRVGDAARRPRRGDIPVLVVSGLALAFVLAPVANLVWRSLATPSGLGLGNYRALTDPGASPALRVSVTEAVGNSLRTAVDATLLAVVLGVCVAVVVSRRPRRPWARRLVSGLDGAFMLPLGISAVTVGFGFLITLDRPPL